jgi:penicillin amidase
MGFVGRWFFRLIVTFVLLAILAGVGGYLFVRGSLAQLDGQATGNGLSALVTVTRDANGVPAITGQSRADVAFATGFLHAQERFFQMDLMRRVAAGELAELVGPVALPVDKQHRFYRFRARAEAAYKASSPEDRQLLERYADGANAGLAALTTRPPDYLLTMTKPRPWAPADSLLVVWAMYFDLQDSLETRKWELGWLKDHTSPDQLAFLLPEASGWDAPLDGPSPAPELKVPATAPDWWNKPAETKASALSSEHGELVGSNNWVLAGNRVKGGHALLANDMHLGLRLPPVWYRMLLIYPDGQGGQRKIVGAGLPGTPIIVAGSNGHVAWGATNAAGDWLDIIRLDQDSAHPGQVKLGEDWISPAVSEETIAVKGGASEKLMVRETPMGPIRESNGQVYAIHWLAQDAKASDLGIRRLEDTSTAVEALDVAASSGVPELNFVAADEAGHIGWGIAGPMGDRGAQDQAFAYPLEPDQIASSWHQLLAPAAHPRIVDPAGGQLFSANSRQLIGEGSALIGDGGFDLGARTRQVRDDLLALPPETDVQASYAVELDDRALFMTTWRDRALAVLDSAAVADHPDRAEFKRLLTESWDGHASVGSVGYRLTRGWLYALYDESFVGLDDKLATLGQGATYREATRRWPVVIARLLETQPAGWLPAGRKDWRDVQLAAIDKTIAALTSGGRKLSDATWGSRNTADVAHPFAKFVPLIKSRLTAPADQMPGDSHMPRVSAPDFGQSERLVVTPGKEEEGLFNLPGGQSGHPLSPFFLAEFENWAQGKPEPLMPGVPKYGLVLTPN